MGGALPQSQVELSSASSSKSRVSYTSIPNVPRIPSVQDSLRLSTAAPLQRNSLSLSNRNESWQISSASRLSATNIISVNQGLLAAPSIAEPPNTLSSILKQPSWPSTKAHSARAEDAPSKRVSILLDENDLPAITIEPPNNQYDNAETDMLENKRPSSSTCNSVTPVIVPVAPTYGSTTTSNYLDVRDSFACADSNSIISSQLQSRPDSIASIFKAITGLSMPGMERNLGEASPRSSRAAPSNQPNDSTNAIALIYRDYQDYSSSNLPPIVVIDNKKPEELYAADPILNIEAYLLEDVADPDSEDEDNAEDGFDTQDLSMGDFDTHSQPRKSSEAPEGSIRSSFSIFKGLSLSGVFDSARRTRENSVRQTTNPPSRAASTFLAGGISNIVTTAPLSGNDSTVVSNSLTSRGARQLPTRSRMASAKTTRTTESLKSFWSKASAADLTGNTKPSRLRNVMTADKLNSESSMSQPEDGDNLDKEKEVIEDVGATQTSLDRTSLPPLVITQIDGEGAPFELYTAQEDEILESNMTMNELGKAAHANAAVVDMDNVGKNPSAAAKFTLVETRQAAELHKRDLSKLSQVSELGIRTSTSYIPHNLLHRRNSLPNHPEYVSKAFRSIPRWLPFQGRHIATVCLIVTVATCVANLAYNIRNALLSVEQQ
jgi:hypothetical protein